MWKKLCFIDFWCLSIYFLGVVVLRWGNYVLGIYKILAVASFWIRLLFHENFMFTFPPLITGFNLNTSVSSAWQNLWHKDRPAHCVLLPQASSGHCKRGRQDRWDVLLHRCICSHSSFHPLSPSCNEHTSLPGLSFELCCDWCYIHDMRKNYSRGKKWQSWCVRRIM